MLKRILAINLCVLIALITCFNYDTKVCATVVNPVDDNTHYYFANNFDFSNWSLDDFLTIDNYDNYYDSVTGDLKTKVNNLFYGSSVTYSGDRLLNTLMYNDSYFDTQNNAFDIHNTYFVPIVVDGNTIPFNDCKHIISFIDNYGVSTLNLISIYYSDYDNNLINIVENNITCGQTIYITIAQFNAYQFDYNNIELLSFKEINDFNNNTFTSIFNGWSYEYYPFSGCLNNIIYSDLPVYFSSSENINDINYGFFKINDIIFNNDTDSFGFVIDRRTQKFIDALNGNLSNNNSIVQDGFNPKLFNGSLGFNSFNASAALNYNSTTEKYEPYFDIKYQPNNYTEINIDDVSIYYQAEVDLKLTFTSDFNSFYSMTTRYKTSGQGSLDRSGTSPNANRYEFILYAMNNPPLGNSSWNNTSLRNTAGLSSHFNVNPFTGSSVDGDITIGVSAYKHNNYVVTDPESNVNELINDIFSGTNGKGNRTYNSYGLYKIQIYIKNNVTGDISNTYTAAFDLYGNKIADNSNSMINNDDNAYNNFVNDFYYVDDNGDLKPIDYADHINVNGGDNNNVINIQNPQYPYLLVDIPENEWINKTPNLKNLLTDFKTMLAETNEGSILTMLPATYNYLPAPVMQYLLYGVGLIVMIGIWRAITRR